MKKKGVKRVYLIYLCCERTPMYELYRPGFQHLHSIWLFSGFC